MKNKQFQQIIGGKPARMEDFFEKFEISKIDYSHYSDDNIDDYFNNPLKYYRK